MHFMPVMMVYLGYCHLGHESRDRCQRKQELAHSLKI